jgi:hypothetical protein
MHGMSQDLARDSATTDVRTFSDASLDKYKTGKQFQYEKSFEPPKSLWTRFWNWVWSKIGDILSTKGGAATFKTILILLAIAVLAFFIYRLTGMSRSGLFGRKDGSRLDYSTADENIHTINFEAAIQQAIEDGNYRLAVRLLYLQSLKYLADRELINWQVNKTNIAYVQELGGTAYQRDFDDLTRQFENNWYGDVPIAVSEFGEVRNQFSRFNRQLI